MGWDAAGGPRRQLYHRFAGAGLGRGAGGRDQRLAQCRAAGAAEDTRGYRETWDHTPSAPNQHLLPEAGATSPAEEEAPSLVVVKVLGCVSSLR